MATQKSTSAQRPPRSSRRSLTTSSITANHPPQPLPAPNPVEQAVKLGPYLRVLSVQQPREELLQELAKESQDREYMLKQLDYMRTCLQVRLYACSANPDHVESRRTLVGRPWKHERKKHACSSKLCPRSIRRRMYESGLKAIGQPCRTIVISLVDAFDPAAIVAGVRALIDFASRTNKKGYFGEGHRRVIEFAVGPNGGVMVHMHLVVYGESREDLIVRRAEKALGPMLLGFGKDWIDVEEEEALHRYLGKGPVETGDASDYIDQGRGHAELWGSLETRENFALAARALAQLAGARLSECGGILRGSKRPEAPAAPNRQETLEQAPARGFPVEEIEAHAVEDDQDGEADRPASPEATSPGRHGACCACGSELQPVTDWLERWEYLQLYSSTWPSPMIPSLPPAELCLREVMVEDLFPPGKEWNAAKAMLRKERSSAPTRPRPDGKPRRAPLACEPIEPESGLAEPEVRILAVSLEDFTEAPWALAKKLLVRAA